MNKIAGASMRVFGGRLIAASAFGSGRWAARTTMVVALLLNSCTVSTGEESTAEANLSALSSVYVCNSISGTTASCYNRNVRFSAGGAGLEGALYYLGQSTDLGKCGAYQQQKFDFVLQTSTSNPYYRVQSSTTSLCMAPYPTFDSSTVEMVPCGDCQTGTTDRCLWRFTGDPGGVYRLQNKYSGKCLYGPHGETFITTSPLQQHDCSSDDLTKKREILFFDDFNTCH